MVVGFFLHLRLLIFSSNWHGLCLSLFFPLLWFVSVPMKSAARQLLGTAQEQWSSSRDRGRVQLPCWCCVSNWCALCLRLFSLLGLQGRTGHGEDVQVHKVGQQSGSWRDRVQWVVGVEAQPRGRSFT